ncbi:hypothetical protein PG987_015092 [Apiospora arundinis]
MEPHEQLLQWAEAKGVKLDGIAPQRLPGRGVGIVATRAIQPDEILLEVPAKCLRSIETVPKSLSRRLPGTSRSTACWPPTWPWTPPTPTRPGMPSVSFFFFFFPPSLDVVDVYEEEAVNGDKKTEKTKTKTTEEEEQETAKQKFVHAWLLVNTRTFYHESPRLRRRAKEDRMVLQPVADLFNHAGSRTGWCHVAFDAASFTVRADRRYEAGDEVRICYGRHGGDLLLVEYGFVLGGDVDDDDDTNGHEWLEENCWDEVGLDDVLLPRLSDSAKDKLSEVGFLGGYVLDAGNVCYRTQVALRALCCLQTGREEEWRRFIEDGEDADAARQGEVDGLFISMLEEYREQTIGKTLLKVAAMKDEEGSSKDQRELLCKRWRHVDRLVRITIERLKSETTNKTL